MIVRSPRPQSGFYILQNKIAEDQRLSWAARGLLIFLLVKPDDWKIRGTAALVKQTKGAFKHTGRDGVYSLLQELIDAGYITRTQPRGADGEFRNIDYLVSETPAESSASGNGEPAPLPAQPEAAEPLTAEPTLPITQSNQKPRGPTLHAAEPRAISPELMTVDDLVGDGLSEQVAGEWIAYRRKRRAPLTQIVWQEIKKEAAKAGMSPESAVRKALARGWTGFEAAWVSSSGSGIGRRQPSIHDKRAACLAALTGGIHGGNRNDDVIIDL